MARTIRRFEALRFSPHHHDEVFPEEPGRARADPASRVRPPPVGGPV